MESGNLGDIVIWGNDSGMNISRRFRRVCWFDWNEDDILTDYGRILKNIMPYALEKMQTFPAVLPMDMVLMWRWIQRRGDIMYTWDVRWDLYKRAGLSGNKESG